MNEVGRAGHRMSDAYLAATIMPSRLPSLHPSIVDQAGSAVAAAISSEAEIQEEI